MKRTMKLYKIANAAFVFLMSAYHIVSATETDRVRTKVNGILENFRRNMEEYYQRTRSIRKVAPTKPERPDFLETLETKNAKPEQLNQILEYRWGHKREIAKTDGKSVVSFADAMQTNPRLKENLEMLAGGEASKEKFLNKVYEKYADGLLSLKKGISEAEAKEAHKLFNGACQQLKGNPCELTDDELQRKAHPFPSSVSQYGNYMIAAKDRLVLEEKLRDPAIHEKIKNLIEAAYLVDLSKKEDFTLPRNPQKRTVYSFQDAKTSDIAAANPNYIAHVLADAYSPGGGMLKGTALQEEMTLRAARDVQLALYAIATAGFYPLQTYQALTLGNYVFSAMVDNRPGEGDAPPQAKDYVQTVILKLDALIRAAILQAQRLNNTQPKVLILGGAGCGAFKNDPQFVAHVFYHILKKYRGYFDQVIFGVWGGNKELKVKEDPSLGLKYQPFKDCVEKLNQES